MEIRQLLKFEMTLEADIDDLSDALFCVCRFDETDTSSYFDEFPLPSN